MNADGQPDILLIDNGSRRPASTLSLRRLAGALSRRVGRTVAPVSLLHSDRVAPAMLDGQPADLLPAFLERRLIEGQRHFITLPLFFGPSRALSRFIPEQVERLCGEFGSFRLEQADVLCPLPQGEPLLAGILADNVTSCGPAERVIVVDHGSPIPQVTAVRNWLAAALKDRLRGDLIIDEAVMERREGADYDFNGALLAEKLDGLTGRVVVAMLFISPGRHAGPGGDIAEICDTAEQANPGLMVTPSSLIGDHPLLVDLLARRLDGVLQDGSRGMAAAG